MLSSPNNKSLVLVCIGFSSWSSPLLLVPLFPPDLGDFSNNLFVTFIINAAVATPGIEPGVCPLNPNIAFNNFSAGTINPKHTITYNGSLAANLIADPISNIYNIKCRGCSNKL